MQSTGQILLKSYRQICCVLKCLEKSKQKIVTTNKVSFFKSLKCDIQIRVMHVTECLIHVSKSTGGTKIYIVFWENHIY